MNAKDLIFLINNYWYERVGLITAYLLSLTILIPALLISEARIENSIIIILLTIIVITIIWWYTKRPPRTPKNKIGFLVSIACSSEEELTKVREDFSIPLQQLLRSGKAGKAFEFIEIPQHIAKTVIELDDAQRLRLNCRAKFILYGRVRIRKFNDQLRHFVDLGSIVAHKPIPETVQKSFASEFYNLFPHRVSIPTEGDIFGFEFTSEWTGIVTKYIIGLATLYSGDLGYAERLFQDVKRDLTTRDSTFPIFNKLQRTLPIRISQIQETKAVIAHHSWVDTHEQRFVDQLGNALEQIDENRKGSAPMINLLAIYSFLSDRNVDKALALLRKLEDQDIGGEIFIGTWHYNMAFLLGYKEDLKGAIRQYREAIKFCVGWSCTFPN